MKFLAVVKRRPGWSVLLRILAVILTAAGVFILARLAENTCGDVTLCTFKKATGLPCPSCGITRAIIAISHGRLIDALLLNPLITTALAVSVVWLLLWWVPGIVITMKISRREFWVMMALLVVAIAANWIYVIKYVG